MYDAMATLGGLTLLGVVVTAIFLGGMGFDRYISKFTSWEEFKNDFFN